MSTIKGAVLLTDLANELNLHPGALKEYARSVGIADKTLTSPATGYKKEPYVTEAEASLLRKALSDRKAEEIESITQDDGE